jgi:hypothetical protein
MKENTRLAVFASVTGAVPAMTEVVWLSQLSASVIDATNGKAIARVRPRYISGRKREQRLWGKSGLQLERMTVSVALLP